jgi:hypothetical protein
MKDTVGIRDDKTLQPLKLPDILAMIFLFLFAKSPEVDCHCRVRHKKAGRKASRQVEDTPARGPKSFCCRRTDKRMVLTFPLMIDSSIYDRKGSEESTTKKVVPNARDCPPKDRQFTTIRTSSTYGLMEWRASTSCESSVHRQILTANSRPFNDRAAVSPFQRSTISL